MNIVISNPIGRLDNGKHLVLFPTRCDWVGDSKPFSYYPYELAYLSTLLKQETEQNVIMVDPNIEQLNPAETVQRLAALTPDILVTECGHLTYPSMTRVMRELKGQHWVYAILTGPYGTSFPDRARADGWDLVVAGEYEAKILAHLTGEDIKAGYIDIDALPFPEDEDISRIYYNESSNPYSGMVQVYPTRGCPLSCSFCTVPIYYGGHGHSHKSHRNRNPELVCDELDYLAGKYPQFSGAFFNDETHNADPIWLAEFADTLIRRGLDRYHYDAMCGYWTMTAALLDKLAKAGYCQIRLGLESFDGKVGAEVGKRIFENKFIDVLRNCKANGMRTYVTTMVGAPGSSLQGDLATYYALMDLRQKGLLDIVQHSTSTPNPGTAFHAQALHEGWLTETDQASYHWKSPVINYPNYSAEEIGQMNRLFYELKR